MSRYFNQEWFLFFLIFPFFNPTALKYIPGLTYLYNFIQIWKLVSIFVIIFGYMIRRKITRIISLILLFEAVAIVTSIINGVFNTKVLTNALLAIGISMLTEQAIKNNFGRFYKILIKILMTLVALNFILCVLFPDGLYFASLYTAWSNPLHFLGIDNALVKELLILLIFLCYAKFCDKDLSIRAKKLNNIKFWSFHLISALTLVIVGSATGLITYILFASLIIIFVMLLKKHIPYRVVVTAYILLTIFIVILGSDLGIIPVITNLAGRSTSFTGRTLLWRKAFLMILERPLWGFGYTSGNIEVWGGMFSSHNLFLELILQGGIIYLTIFVFMTFFVLKKNRVSSMQYFNVMFISIFAYLVIGLMETGVSTGYFMMMVMACYSDARYIGKN